MITKVNRDLIRSIPHDDQIVISKVSELSEDPIQAYYLLYANAGNIERKEIIKKFKELIAEYDNPKS